MVRINKFLAQCNLGSRRKVEEFILAGRVKVNGKITKELAIEIDEENDKVEFDNKIISIASKKYYLILNKPKKYLVTAKDDFGRSTVFDLVPDFGVHLFSVGRLDYMSEGLLILTNDGDFADEIMHPRNKLPKLYKVTVKGYITNSVVQRLRNGVVISGYKTKPAKVFIKSRNSQKTILKITISEGKKRQIRKMIKTIGSEVIDLRRLQIGDLRLSKLPIGMWRHLNKKEIYTLKNYNMENK
ncbi:MAG: rRNA pseudouridine synthase [Candidatus Cloacimonetes bacterium]|nr:rRNA pseudouridine synthase [Candidatus Cloacimonadota bacterium]MCF7813853.1 rRNA pseudouridine synthase [Candidatus Cloacimonadota bacterium]MCF7868291.1 rRNA pseudouridine synthase [Candidatus Cloacimonadota bacterium]MCF7883735.1 rRNA pseudouridine synthase [Candidatus Cloacimonadota bacterium]